MRTIQTTVYTFDELSEQAKEKAIEKLRDINVHFGDWHESTLDTIKDAGEFIGIDIDSVYYSGFWSQGDGACFVGSYHYRKGSVADIRREFPAFVELHELAERLQAIQRPAFYDISARVEHRGRYYHHLSTSIDVFRNGDYADEETSDDVAQILREFMQWSYGLLESEYEYQTSDEAVIEGILANDYEFTEDGDIA